ncbi:metallophosphoesterase [Clostridium nitritogenes]|uniref:Metallophosphoesterase n=1 Tax=Clostridium nitritogenes TaxID=83340 RepID=A0ABN1LHY8_9CLOT
MRKIKWVHLSDVHYNYNNYNSEWLRDSILKFFENKNNKFDILIITGDLLYQFGSDFEEIKKFLNILIQNIEISKENVFIVPGNHDFERSEIRKLIIEGIKNNGEEISESVDKLKDTTIDLLINGQGKFWEFHEGFLERKDKYNEVHFINYRNQFNIINLNTCLISGTDNEEGSLSIHLGKLMKTLKNTDSKNKINIAIGHHSIECFNEKEQEEIINIFEDYNIDLYLCGHMHKSKYRIYAQGNREIPSIVCGANMADTYAEPSFVIGEIDLDTAYCNVKYYKWGVNKKWIVNNEVDRKVTDDGKLSFTLTRLQQSEEMNNELIYEKIQKMTNVNVEQDKFERFLISFCKEIVEFSDGGDIEINKDVQDKFLNMRCNKTIEIEFNSHVEYFTLIDKILSDTGFIPYDRKIAIPGVIISTYTEVVDSSTNGNEILNKMINLLSSQYKDVIGLPVNDLKQYFKTIIFWSINKCDIYNEVM